MHLLHTLQGLVLCKAGGTVDVLTAEIPAMELAEALDLELRVFHAKSVSVPSSHHAKSGAGGTLAGVGLAEPGWLGG